MAWKIFGTFFHGVEKTARFFHTVEPCFPHRGKSGIALLVFLHAASPVPPHSTAARAPAAAYPDLPLQLVVVIICPRD
ncbi:MAG TPA: hypothetical protein P5306_05760 [Kiritimatiellia bacterium]|nr:hypothetical protein [Kiritimatiellia bacterium]